MSKRFYREIDLSGQAVKYAEIAPEGFEEITNPEEIKKQEKKLFKKRAKKGLEVFDDIRVNFALELNNGLITEDEALLIYEKLSKAKSYLVSGDWILARRVLNNINLIEGEVYNTDRHNYVLNKVESAFIELENSFL